MMAIGDLYSRGNGVPADKTLAQSWQARAESCQGGNLASLEQQIAQYRARAAAAREPVTYPMMEAIPAMRAVPKSRPPVARNGHDETSRINRMVTALVVMGAIDALMPSSPNAGAGDASDDSGLGASNMVLQNFTCTNSGGSINFLGGCSH